MSDTPKDAPTPVTETEKAPSPTKSKSRTLALLVIVGVSLLVLFYPNKAMNPAKTTADVERETFWNHWGDKKAEISTYQLSQPWPGNNGENRSGYALLLTNIQDMELAIPGPKDAPAPIPKTVSTLSLKVFKRFRAGITDTSLELSTFVPLSDWNVGTQTLPRFLPARTTMNSQTWLRSAYQYLQPLPEGLQLASTSSEAPTPKLETFPYRLNMLSEDALFLAVRDLGQPLVSGNYAIFSSLLVSDVQDEKPSWLTAVVTKGTDIIPKDCPLGSFNTTRTTVQLTTNQSSRTYQFFVEREYPKRIIAWEVTSKAPNAHETTETAELVNSIRADYWNQLGHEFERGREVLHLP